MQIILKSKSRPDQYNMDLTHFINNEVKFENDDDDKNNNNNNHDCFVLKILLDLLN